MDQDSAGIWYGFLSLFAGILGVLLVAQSVVRLPRSDVTFSLGLFTFGAAFLLKIFHLIYRRGR